MKSSQISRLLETSDTDGRAKAYNSRFHHLEEQQRHLVQQMPWCCQCSKKLPKLQVRTKFEHENISYITEALETLWEFMYPSVVWSLPLISIGTGSDCCLSPFSDVSTFWWIPWCFNSLSVRRCKQWWWIVQCPEWLLGDARPVRPQRSKNDPEFQTASLSAENKNKYKKHACLSPITLPRTGGNACGIGNCIGQDTSGKIARKPYQDRTVLVHRKVKAWYPTCCPHTCSTLDMPNNLQDCPLHWCYPFAVGKRGKVWPPCSFTLHNSPFFLCQYFAILFSPKRLTNVTYTCPYSDPWVSHHGSQPPIKRSPFFGQATVMLHVIKDQQGHLPLVILFTCSDGRAIHHHICKAQRGENRKHLVVGQKEKP